MAELESSMFAEKGTFKFLNTTVQWAAGEKKTMILMQYVRIALMPMWLATIIVRILYQYRQFGKSFPAPGSWAYKLLLFGYDIEYFWLYKIRRIRPEVQSDDDLMGIKPKEDREVWRENHGSNIPEPDPKVVVGADKGKRLAMWDLVMDDMRKRDEFGTEKYGTRLYANNGRDPLWDAYQEILDLAVYLRQALFEKYNK